MSPVHYKFCLLSVQGLTLTSASDIYRRQILTSSKVGPRTEKINHCVAELFIFFIDLFGASKIISTYGK